MGAAARAVARAVAKVAEKDPRAKRKRKSSQPKIASWRPSRAAVAAEGKAKETGCCECSLEALLLLPLPLLLLLLLLPLLCSCRRVCSHRYKGTRTSYI